MPSVCMNVRVLVRCVRPRARAQVGGGGEGGRASSRRLFLGGFGAWRERERVGAPGC